MNSKGISQIMDLRIQGALLLLAVLCLGGCAEHQTYAGLAPMPPVLFPREAREEITTLEIENQVSILSTIETAAGAGSTMPPEAASWNGFDKGAACPAVSAAPSNYLVAYQWGDDGHNRFGLAASQLRYTYNFQPARKKKTGCAQKAAWTGLLTRD